MARVSAKHGRRVSVPIRPRSPAATARIAVRWCSALVVFAVRQSIVATGAVSRRGPEKLSRSGPSPRSRPRGCRTKGASCTLFLRVLSCRVRVFQDMLLSCILSGSLPCDSQSQVPVFLDLLSGPKCPLSHAFHSAGWRVLQPIDFLIDPAFDVTDSQVQHSIVLARCCPLVTSALQP